MLASQVGMRQPVHVPVAFLTEGYLTDGIAGAVGFHWLTVLPPSNARPEKNGISRTAKELSTTRNR